MPLLRRFPAFRHLVVLLIVSIAIVYLAISPLRHRHDHDVRDAGLWEVLDGPFSLRVPQSAAATRDSAKSLPAWAMSDPPPMPTSAVDRQQYLDDMLNWRRPPDDDHWPELHSYIGKDYDPYRWEGFEE